MGQIGAYKYSWRGFASRTVHLTWTSPCIFVHLHRDRDDTMVLKRKILCGPRVGCYLGSRAHHGYIGSTTGEKMHASFLPATLSGLGNITGLSMWLGQQRSCIFASADRLLMIFTAVLLVLILQLPRLGTCHRSHHRSHKHMCMHMSGKKWERTRTLHGFCPDME